MTWKTGQSGNPAGRLPNEKLFGEALRMAVIADDRKKLRRMAEKLVDLAIAGESWAMQQVADRLDGKPAQESTVNVNDGRDRMSDAELRTLIAAAVAGTVSSGNGAAESDDPAQLH